MDYSVGLKVFKYGREKVVVGYVANEQFDGLSGQFLPHADAIGQRLDGRQWLYAKLKIPLPPQKVVDDGDVVTGFGKIERARPTAVAVTTQHADSHAASPSIFLKLKSNNANLRFANRPVTFDTSPRQFNTGSHWSEHVHQGSRIRGEIG